MSGIITGLTAAEIAAMAAAGTAATAGAAGAGAGALGAGALGAGAVGAGTAAELAAPALAEGATTVAPAMGLDEAFMPLDAMHGGPEPAAGGMDPMSSFRNLSEGNLTKEITAPMQELGNSVPSITDSFTNIGQGDIGGELGNAMKMPGGDAMNPMSLFGGGGGEAPMPAPTPLPAEPSAPAAPATPSTPGTPMSMKDKVQGAHAALRLASKLTTNKKDKQMLGLLSMSTALGSSGGDLSSPESINMLNGPLEDISSSIEQPKPAQPPRLNQALSPLDAPSTRAPTPGGPVNPNGAPGTARGSGALPPTRLVDEAMWRRRY